MLPTFLTVLAAAALGGAIAANITVLAIAAVIALVVLGVVNGVRGLERLFD